MATNTSRALTGTRKLIRVGIEIPFQRLRLDPKRRNELPIFRKPEKLRTIREALLRDQIGDLGDGEPFGNSQRMEQHLAVEQHRENLRRSHAGIQLILTCMNFPVGRLGFPKKDKGRTALDQSFALKQRRDMLKRRAIRDDDDFRGRMLFRGNNRAFSPANRLIGRDAKCDHCDQQTSENDP